MAGRTARADVAGGAPCLQVARDGNVVADGKVIAIDAPNRLEMTFHAHWDPELEAEGPVREVYLLEDEKMGLTKLTVELYDAAPDSKKLADTIDHVPFIISGLKTLLETGTPLVA